MEVALFDYGTGNLHSLAKALERGGARVRIEASVARALQADALVLPGVGAFGAAAARLAGAPAAPSGPGGQKLPGIMAELLEETESGTARLREALAGGMPCLAICLGMQLLFEGSEEGAGRGVGALRGRVRRVQARRVPHMGWNEVEGGGAPLFTGVEGMMAYYANSFAVEADEPEDVLAWTSYGADRFPAAVRRGNTFGVQFHPEKSGTAGLRLVANFLAAAR
ncbi:MAG: imidazole glycerol phosphate synthase subunit HisH [Gemmatimonadota bacterium]